MNHTLESHRLFPIVAWTIVFCFAGFTFFLATELKANMDSLGARVDNLEERVNAKDGR